MLTCLMNYQTDTYVNWQRCQAENLVKTKNAAVNSVNQRQFMEAGMSGWPETVPDFFPNGTNLGLLKIIFSTI